MGIWTEEASVLTDIDLIFVNLSLLFAIVGYVFIRKREPVKHFLFMGAATISLGLFLVFYVLNYLIHGVTRYGGDDWTKIFYYPFLFAHIVTASATGFTCLYLAITGLKRTNLKKTDQWEKFDFEEKYRNRHVSIGFKGFLGWIITVISGDIIYLLLYVVYSPA